MEKHVKPTQEELDANAQKALEEAEKIKAGEENKEEVIPPKEEEKENKEEKQEEIDYKKKFSESSREAQILHSKNKKINEAIEKAKLLLKPTEEELRKEFTEWDLMGDTEKKLATDSMISTRRFEILNEATMESKDIEAWNDKVDSFISDPKTITDNPELEGKEEDFRYFAGKTTRRGVDFEDLVSAFLYGKTKSKPVNKGKMFEIGSGGANEKPKNNSGKISLEQARQLRKTDYPKYKEYLNSGKIESEF